MDETVTDLAEDETAVANENHVGQSRHLLQGEHLQVTIIIDGKEDTPGRPASQ